MAAPQHMHALHHHDGGGDGDEDHEQHVIMHQMPRFDGDADQSVDLGSVSHISMLQDRTDEEYSQLLATLERKHAWRRKSLKVVASVIRLRLSAERMICNAMKNSAQNPDTQDGAPAPLADGDIDGLAARERERVQKKDLIEFIAGGSVIDIEARIKRLEEMDTRVNHLESEIVQQTKVLPKLCKDIAKREQKLQAVLEKIKRKSQEIREDFRNANEKDRLRKRIEALKLEGKYFEVNQLERINGDRKQTVANMLPELEKREISLKELICAGANSLRAQADAYEAATEHLVVPAPRIIARHVYASDFLENGHPKGEPRSIAPSDMSSSACHEPSEATPSVWSQTTGTSQCGNGEDGCMGVAVGGSAVSDTGSVTGSEVSENIENHNPQHRMNTQQQPSESGDSAMTPDGKRQRGGGSMRLSDSKGSSRMRGIGIRKKRAFASHGRASSRFMRGSSQPRHGGAPSSITHTTHDDLRNESDAAAAAANHLQQRPTQYAARLSVDPPRTPQNTGHRRVPPTPPSHAKRSARKNAAGSGTATCTTPSQQRRHGSAQHRENEIAQIQHDIEEEHDHEHDEKHADDVLVEQVASNLNMHTTEVTQNRRVHEVVDLSPATSPEKEQEFARAMLVRTPSRSRTRNYDETLSPVQEQDEYHLAAVGR